MIKWNAKCRTVEGCGRDVDRQFPKGEMPVMAKHAQVPSLLSGRRDTDLKTRRSY